MRQAAWRQVTGPKLGMGLFALALTLSLTVAENIDQKAALDADQVVHRQKRAWEWGTLYIEEEKPVINTTVKIGKIKSDKSTDTSRYEIVGEGANKIFKVDEKGDVYAYERLDREVKSQYLLTAKVFDLGGKVLDEDKFRIQVIDINDNSPVFTKSFSASIEEGSKIGKQVIEVTATDADDPTTANAVLAYTLLEGGDMFNIESTKGVITTKSDKLDRETQSSYVIVVQAQDLRGLKQGTTATTSVTITITDINDNIATFTKRSYTFTAKEDMKPRQEIGTMILVDRDEIQNKDPQFEIPPSFRDIFEIEQSQTKDANIVLKKGLDYETKNSYTFSVIISENKLKPGDPMTTAQVTIRVIDVDEKPEFSKSVYNFNVTEEDVFDNIGMVSARDPDTPKKSIGYFITDSNSPFGIHRKSGILFTVRKLDRELVPSYIVQVKAKEEPAGLESFVYVKILVIDINDNEPELSIDEIYVCENDMTGKVIGILVATDTDDQPSTFSFTLANPSGNFTVIDNKNNTASVVLKHGGFSLEDPRDYAIDIGISDGGTPPRSSVTPLPIKVCRCDNNRRHNHCKAAQLKMGVSVHALIAILLCILTILVIVILIVMRKRYRKDSLVTLGKSEIHEQLVTYDEEGGGEMDTNGYDVSILTLARHDGSMSARPGPSVYAVVKRTPPTACKGDMAVMIDVKKDEADRDRDGIPYDTLHIYGYEGPESLAGSLSSLDSSSAGSNLDYDLLNDWGPRFRTLAELYGVDGSDGSDSSH
ncbi:hypothetical protein DPEC_G00345660 [Dallia pectoralis]|uniref:Uncharacterized protein n=1 Tax=Dallia pectoralis TaxID=75939 RepID=A0ACC2F3N6_DALPE|nr:hypothetical protein DPEC_G00345660 [Dallia pectoralis]